MQMPFASVEPHARAPRRSADSGQARPVAGRRACRRGRRLGRAASGRTCGASPPRDDARHLGRPRGAAPGRRRGVDAGDVRLRRPLDGRAADRAHGLRPTTRRRSRSTASSAFRSRAGIAAMRCATAAMSTPWRWPGSIPHPPIDLRLLGDEGRKRARRLAREVLARDGRRRGLGARDLGHRRRARLVPEPRRRRQRAGRSHRLFLRDGGAVRARHRHVPRLRRALRQDRRAVAADARVHRAIQRPRPARAGGRLADRSLREGDLHPAGRPSPRDAGQPQARCARRDRLPRRAQRRRREADRPDRLVERRQHRARRHQPAPSRRRPGDHPPRVRDRLLSRLRGRPEARLRAVDAAPDAGRRARRLDAVGALRRPRSRCR